GYIAYVHQNELVKR
nr:RecName: Full=Unknown protein 22 [Pseudotsuga menziesii]